MSYEIKFEDCGDEGRSALIILHDGKEVARHYDGGEPEDNFFFRDWSWVGDALLTAYNYGLIDGYTKIKACKDAHNQ